MRNLHALDWFVIVAPFVVIGGMGWWTVHHHQKRCVCCWRQHPTVAARRLHEQIWRAM